LAYECDKGKLSLGKIEAFNNVQCESCHGPGELHVKSKGEQSMKPLPTVQTCLKCHTPERSGEGGFEYRFDKICVKKKT
jgi:mono/diheme cytochrome c family protein